MAVDWFYMRAGQIVGPLSAEQIREHALERKIAPADHVRRGGDGNWVPAAKVKGLFDPPPDTEMVPKLESAPRGTADAFPSASSNPKLIDCPDCGKSVSRRAEQCPHCGCPIGEAKPQQVVVQAPTPQVKVFEVVFRCVVQAVRDIGYAIGRVDKHNGMIVFKTGVSLWSFGQDISLVVVDMGKTCSIDMTSRSHQVTDWGESKRIGQKIVARAQALLAAEGMPNVLQ